MDIFEQMFAGGKSLLSESFTVEMVYTMTCSAMGYEADTPLDCEFQNLDAALQKHAGKGAITIGAYQQQGAHRTPASKISNILTISEFLGDKLADPQHGDMLRRQISELVKKGIRKHAAGDFSYAEIQEDYETEAPILHLTAEIDGGASKRYFLGYGLDDGDWFDPWLIDSEAFHDVLAKEVAKGRRSLYVFDADKSIIEIDTPILEAVRQQKTYSDWTMQQGHNDAEHRKITGTSISGIVELEEKIKEALATYEAEGFYEARIQSKDKFPDPTDDVVHMDIRYYASQLG